MKTIQIEGGIGWDVTADSFKSQLTNDDIELDVNSGGGSLFEAIAIHNAIRAHRAKGYRVTAKINGLAASAATYIAVAADNIQVSANSTWMVHNPSLFAAVDINAAKKLVTVLEGATNLLARGYTDQRGLPMDVVRKQLDDETWLFGNEIVVSGYADTLLDDEQLTDRESALLQAKSDHLMIQNLLAQHPARIDALFIEPMELAMPEPESSAPAAPNNAADAAAIIAAERQRVKTIIDRCTSAHMTQLIDQFIESGASIENVNAVIIDAWVASGKPEIQQAQPVAAAPVINVSLLQRKLFEQVSTGAK